MRLFAAVAAMNVKTIRSIFLQALILETASAFHTQFSQRIQPSKSLLFAKKDKVSFDAIDVDDLVDPEWVEQGTDENYDNDFDVNAFQVDSYSCVVNYDDITSPFISSLESESTWIVYDDENGVCAPAGPVGQWKEIISNKVNEPLSLVIISASVLASCLLVAISTIDGMPYQSELLVAENVLNVVFAIDFFARWFSSTNDTGRHVLAPQFALDVAVVLFPLVFGLMPDVDKAALPLPAWLTSPSALINLELLRVLRLRRVLRDKQSFLKFEKGLGLKTGVEDWQLQLARVLLSLFTLLSVSTGLIYTAENGVNPCISNYFTALYFGLVTLSTVGFGDIVPMTPEGKFVVSGSIVVGAAVIPAQAAALVEALLARKELKKEQKRSKKKSGTRKNESMNDDDGKFVLETAFKCPNCGSKMHWSAAQYCWSCGDKFT